MGQCLQGRSLLLLRLKAFFVDRWASLVSRAASFRPLAAYLLLVMPPLPYRGRGRAPCDLGDTDPRHAQGGTRWGVSSRLFTSAEASRSLTLRQE